MKMYPTNGRIVTFCAKVIRLSYEADPDRVKMEATGVFSAIGAVLDAAPKESPSYAQAKLTIKAIFGI